MLDDDDVNTFWLVSMFSSGWGALFALVAFVVVAVIVAGNHDECSKKTCPNGQTPKLMNHACLCATEAR